MQNKKRMDDLFSQFVVKDNHHRSNYFGLIREIIENDEVSNDPGQKNILLGKVYSLVRDEIVTTKTINEAISFGTSGWRGYLGKEINLYTVSCVTNAIVEIYKEIVNDTGFIQLLSVNSFKDAQERGCVVGFDNRFCGELLASSVVNVLQKNGITVYYAGESTTGVLSAAVLELGAAFSINLTPSHNPLEYGGYKFNAADAGPATSEITKLISEKSNRIARDGIESQEKDINDMLVLQDVEKIDSLKLWQNFVQKKQGSHKLDLGEIKNKILDNKDEISLVVDAVHGASRLHIKELFGAEVGKCITVLRSNFDVTFGGVAPEPSGENMTKVVETLQASGKRIKFGAIIDPDGDRIRFTDGTTEISMNQFGAMAYHYLHENKGVEGLVAKTVASSNLANKIAEKLGEEIFEPRVGFKEFKPVIGKAVVLFEESDGISIIGHTPEKDAYIGLVLALDMVLTKNMNLGDYLKEIESCYGSYYPIKDSVEVGVKGAQLLSMLDKLSLYKVGDIINVNDGKRTITDIIDIDGLKIVFSDDSWLMIRPSGTEPKIRFYVESRDKAGAEALVDTAKSLLRQIGVLQ